MKNKFYSLERDGLTQGLLAMWLSCRQKARWFLQGWATRSISMGLTYGTVVHAVNEKVYEEVLKGKLKTCPSSLYIKKCIKEVEAIWRKENPRADKRTLENLELSLAIAEATMPSYFNYWKGDLKSMKWKNVESSFSIPFEIKHGNNKGRIIPLRGKRDGVFENPRPWLFETKTKSIIVEADLIDTLSFEFQIMLYLLSLRYESKKLPAGVLYNIIRRVNLRRKQNESLKEFADRCVKDVLNRSDFYFMRLEIAITKQELDSFEGELEDMVSDFVNWWEGRSGHYKRTAECITKYGRCVYLPLCSSKQFNWFVKRKKVFRELNDY